MLSNGKPGDHGPGRGERCAVVALARTWKLAHAPSLA